MRGESIQSGGISNRQQVELQKDFARILEKVEKMTGERGDATKPLSSIRRGELRALASNALQSGPVAAAPTMAQFNALQSDVALIFNALALMSNALGTATIPKV